MSQELSKINENPLPEAIEKVLMTGDLTSLSVEQRISYYKAVCSSMGLNPVTNPLAYMSLQGKMTLYAKKECTDQLRNSRKISIQIVSRERIGDLYIVTARATDPSGRYDESTGVVHIAKLFGDALANSLMKAETKAKRRVTLSFSGLSLLDETEVDSINGVKKVSVDYTPPQLNDSNFKPNQGHPSQAQSSTPPNLAGQAQTIEPHIREAQLQKLHSEFLKRGLSEDEYPALEEMMKGRKLAEIDEVLHEYELSQIKEEQAEAEPVISQEEIPF